MKLPQLEKPQKYVGLYIFDFGDHCAVGYTSDEIALLLESEKCAHGKVYKIHRASPDGTMEIKGVPAETFQLEKGLIFYADNGKTANDDFQRLADMAEQTAPPCRAKLQLADYGNGRFAVALIYPAEHDDDVSSWLIKGRYRTFGAVEGGFGAVQGYYDAQPRVLERKQLWSDKSRCRSTEELLRDVNKAVQRRPA